MAAITFSGFGGVIDSRPLYSFVQGDPAYLILFFAEKDSHHYYYTYAQIPDLPADPGKYEDWLGSFHWADAGLVCRSAAELAFGFNQNGSTEIFYREQDSNAIFHMTQSSQPNDVPQWVKDPNAQAGTSAVCMCVARNADGRLELFYGGTDGDSVTDNKIYHRWQLTAGGAWSSDARMDGSGAKTITAARNAGDGRLEVFYSGNSKAIYHDWQVEAGKGWNGSVQLAGKATYLVSDVWPDGRLEIFYTGQGGHHIWHNWHTSAGTNWFGDTRIDNGLSVTFDGVPPALLACRAPSDNALRLFYAGDAPKDSYGRSTGINSLWMASTTGQQWTGQSVGAGAMDSFTACRVNGKVGVYIRTCLSKLTIGTWT